SLCNIRISDADIELLQLNLVRSHAAGAGDAVPPELVKIMLLLKIQSLAQGYSAVREEVVDRLIDFFNADVLPVVFELGSLGASGDLAPLAHLSLPLIGEGECWYEGRRQRADVVLALHHWTPLRFKAKEALAMLNGTQFSAAYAVWCLMEADRLLGWANFNAALGYDAFMCRSSPIDARLQAIRPHAGQVSTAAALRHWLADSAIRAADKESVQDPYAFRCVPQVHGASADALEHIRQTTLSEINAVTDNPNVFPDDDAILSGGNFHAQALALPLDYLALALSELGSISERRVYQLIGGQRGLPAFLTDNPGLHSGFMIAQYTAAAMVSQNKGLCMPASADSMVSCNGQEDHVSMAANAATKARRVVLNLERLLAIELMVGVQALEFRRPLQSSEAVERVAAAYRVVVPRLEADRVLHDDMEASAVFMRSALQGSPMLQKFQIS
ncbi:MAG: HAL/PAL/TAL family ammonia-lyase, partial [Saprospiraceae bacterium]